MTAAIIPLACARRLSSSSPNGITLGTAESFTVLGGSTVTNTGPTTIVGDLGVSPGLAVTGFPPGMVTGGVIHAGDAVALQAQNDLTTAYNELAGQACGVNLSGQDLGGLTLTAGVYCFSSSAQLTGALTLDAEGNPDALFVFQIGSTLTTASNSSVLVINQAQACNVYWQVGSSATVGTATSFIGTIVALTSISLTTEAQVLGRALARNGAVTMDTNHLEPSACVVAGIDAGTDTTDGGGGGMTDGGGGGMTDGGGGGMTDGGGNIDAQDHMEYCGGEVCIDLQTDRHNCGECGHACGWDSECVAGSCTCNETTCGAICVDLTSNPRNCGECGRVCADGEWCDEGACTSVCEGGSVCGGWCTNTQTNEDACGACDHQCAPAETCIGGVCACENLCNGVCVDVETNVNNCGACGRACGANECCLNGQCGPL